MYAVNGSHSIYLKKDSVLSVPDAAGHVVACRDGTVWITLDDDPRDIVLEPGQSFSTPEHRRALVSALQPACVSLRSPVARVARPALRPALQRALAQWSSAFGPRPLAT